VWAAVRALLGVSERRACAVLGQRRSSQRYVRQAPGDEAALAAAIVALASEFGRYGYRRMSALLNRAGWRDGWLVNHKRVERIWRREGLKVPKRQPKRDRRGSTTDRASVCGHAGPTTCGPMTLSRTAPMMGVSSAC
jgi:helix-turn-helix protein